MAPRILLVDNYSWVDSAAKLLNRSGIDAISYHDADQVVQHIANGLDYSMAFLGLPLYGATSNLENVMQSSRQRHPEIPLIGCPLSDDVVMMGGTILFGTYDAALHRPGSKLRIEVASPFDGFFCKDHELRAFPEFIRNYSQSRV